MASSLEVTQKINSLTNIQKVTGAMNLIATIRLRKLASKQKALESFERRLTAWMKVTLPPLAREQASLVAAHRKTTRTLAVVFTSDRGLCGSHNHSVNKAVDRLVRAAKSEGQALEFICLGTKGAVHVRRRGGSLVQQIEMKKVSPASSELRDLAEKTVARFLSSQADTVVLVFNRYLSTLRQATEVQTVLPLARLAPESAGVEPTFDPEYALFAEEAGPVLVQYLFSVALAHSQVSEQAARMTAMDSASKNARDLTNLAIKERNRVRQAGITSELIEIISGKEAMKR